MQSICYIFAQYFSYKSGEGMEGRIADTIKVKTASQDTKNVDPELPSSIRQHITHAKTDHPEIAILNFRLASLKLKVHLLTHKEDETILCQKLDQAIRDHISDLALNHAGKVHELIVEKPQDKQELLNQMISFVNQLAQLFELITYKDKNDVHNLLEIFKFITNHYLEMELYTDAFDIAKKALEVCSKIEVAQQDKFYKQEYRDFFQKISAEPPIATRPQCELKTMSQHKTLQNQWKRLKKTKLLPAPKLVREHSRELLQLIAKIKQAGNFSVIDLKKLNNTYGKLSADLKVIKKEDGLEKIQKLRKEIEKYNSEVQECEDHLAIFTQALRAEKSDERFISTLLPTLDSIPDFDSFSGPISFPLTVNEEKTLVSEQDPIVVDEKLITHAQKPAIAPPKSAIQHVRLVDTVSEKRFGLFFFSELQQIKVKQNSYFVKSLMTKEESDELWNKTSQALWQWP